MDFGIHIGTRGCLTTRDNIMAMASAAEARGYAIIGVADHLIVPVHTDVRYPYTADGIWPGAPTGECLDAIATLSFLAGFTRRIKLLTSVLVVPHRPAVLTAKLLLTADVLSGGRMIAGIGSGWMKEEFAALGTPPFAERGAVTDEYLAAWKALWTQERPAIDGKYVRFENVVCKPKPVSTPHPPIWVGGESAPALRRTVQFGDAWYPVSNNAHILMNTPATLKAGIDRLHRAAEKVGRDPSSIDVGYVWFMPPRWTVKMNEDGIRQMFTGGADAMLEDAAAFRDVGVKHLIVYLQQPTIEQTLDVQQRFAEDVVSKS
ncbi:LLM class F420-dependent oxidoreductase [Rhodopila sp.]|uniref:LLM class F420-dependent oxidoreductase n=1 Tax=Rhodopila sp. TaxID=2480087 RepID=UPI003D119FE5